MFSPAMQTLGVTHTRLLEGEREKQKSDHVGRMKKMVSGAGENGHSGNPLCHFVIQIFTNQVLTCVLA